MRKEIPIPKEESDEIERLFLKYSSYLSMLDYFSGNTTFRDSELYDKKWNEATESWIELDKAKRAAEMKYKPEGNWAGYEYDFERYKVIFYDS